MKNLRSVYVDSELGNVYIFARSNARNITMRLKPDGIYVTASPFATLSHVKDVINEFRPRLFAKLKEMQPHTFFDGTFSLKTDCLSLTFQPIPGQKFMITSRPGIEIIHYPNDTDFRKNGMQEWLKKVVCEALRKQAKLYLPNRLEYLSKHCGLNFNNVTIRGSESRWGSCSSQKNISLSYYLMTLPGRLIDAVLIHELCHTVEMNHGPRFWALMDNYTAGQAKQLTEEIKRYRTGF